jgi:hypothetical protein
MHSAHFQVPVLQSEGVKRSSDNFQSNLGI